MRRRLERTRRRGGPRRYREVVDGTIDIGGYLSVSAERPRQLDKEFVRLLQYQMAQKPLMLLLEILSRSSWGYERP